MLRKQIVFTPCSQGLGPKVHCKYCHADWAREQRKRPLVARLLPIARVLLSRNGDSGTTVSDLRVAALDAQLLTGNESAGELSALGHVFRKAGAMNIRMARRSHLPSTHGIHQIVWFPDIRKHPFSQG